MTSINIDFPDIRPDMTSDQVKAVVPQLVTAKIQLEDDLRKLNKALKQLKSEELAPNEKGQLKAVIDMLEKAMT